MTEVPKRLALLSMDRVTCAAQPRTRFDGPKGEELTASVRLHGVLVPIAVRPDPANPGGHIVIDGERRFHAASAAGLKAIPAIVVEEPLSASEISERQLLLNVQREDLPPLDFARSVKQLMDMTGMNATAVAARLGKATSTITRALALLELPSNLQNAIDSQSLNPSVASELARIDNQAERAALLDGLTNGHITLTRDGLSRARKNTLPRQPVNSEATPAKSMRVVAPLDAHRSITFHGANLRSLNDLAAWLEEMGRKLRKARSQGLSIGTFLRTLCDQTVSPKASAGAGAASPRPAADCVPPIR